jgi:high-affinity K+ transport system ATPase subunit B
MDVAVGWGRHEAVASRRQLFSAPLVTAALKQSFVMLRPDIQWRNPVMFVVEVGAALTLLYGVTP